MNRIKAKDNRLELWISPQLEASFREVLEVEMMTGTRQQLPDGRIYFDMQTTDERREFIRNAILRQISKPGDINYN